jgi:hypothetical protein
MSHLHGSVYGRVTMRLQDWPRASRVPERLGERSRAPSFQWLRHAMRSVHIPSVQG